MANDNEKGAGLRHTTLRFYAKPKQSSALIGKEDTLKPAEGGIISHSIAIRRTSHLSHDNLLDTSVATGDLFHQDKSILSTRFSDLTKLGMTA